MKGLFSYIKNNHIIYKVSVIIVLLVMLISVVQINPKNMKEKNSVGDETIVDYTLRYRTSTDKFYKVKDGSEVEMNDTELNSLGIENARLAVKFDDELTCRIIIFNGVNFKTTEPVALELIGNVYVEVEDSSTNRFVASYDNKAEDFYGIKTEGNVIFGENGSLEVECSNMDTSGNRECYAIYATETCSFINKDLNVIARAKGRNGKAIYAEDIIEISSSTIKAYGGNSGVSEGIVGAKGVKINSGTIYAKATSADEWVGGIETSNHGKGDKVIITGGNITIDVTGDLENNSTEHDGAALHAAAIEVSNANIDISINGKCIWGIWSSAADGYDTGITVGGDANIKINGDIYGKMNDWDYGTPSAILAQNCSFTMNGGNLEVNVENTKDDNIIYGVRAESNIIINDGSIISKVSADNEAENLAIDASENLIVNGGNIVAQNLGNQGYAIYYSNLELKTDADYKMDSIAAATDGEGKNLVEFNKDEYWEYKYLAIGKIYNYYLKFEQENSVWKVNKYNSSDVYMEELQTNEVSGWSIAENNTLVLSGLDFTTSCNKAIEIAGDGSIKVEDGTENKITMTNTVNKKTVYGIYCSDVLNVNGNGQLDIRIFPNDNIGSYIETIYAANGIIIEGSTINIDVKKNSDSSNMTYGINSHLGKIDIHNSNINMEATSSNLVRGIFLSGDSDINIQNSNINMNINADVQAEGIYSSNTSLNIVDSNLTLEVLSPITYGIAAYEDMVIEKSYINIDTYTSDKVYSIYSDNVDNKNKIKINNSYVKINADKNKITYGVCTCPSENNIIIDNSSVEITAKYVMNYMPTLKNDINIAEARIGDIIIKPGVVDSITGYDYVRIEPTYYITYNASDKKLYKNDTTTEITVAGLSVDAVTGHLVMDGFHFTTSSQYGLKCIGDTVIEIKDGSENSINVNYYTTDVSDEMKILSGNGITITGEGILNIGNKEEFKDSAKGKIYGIYVDGITKIDGANVNIELYVYEGELVGIRQYPNSLTICNNSLVKIKNESVIVRDSQGIAGYNVSIEDSTVDIDIRGDRCLNYDWENGEIIYTEGIFDSGALSIDNSVIMTYANIDNYYNITSNEIMTIDRSIINSYMLIDGAEGSVYTENYNLTGDNDIIISDSELNMDMEVDESYNVNEYDIYGIYTYDNKITLNNSIVNAKMCAQNKGKNGIYLITGAYINIYGGSVNADINSNLKNESSLLSYVEGIYGKNNWNDANVGFVNIKNCIVDMDIIAYQGYGIDAHMSDTIENSDIDVRMIGVGNNNEVCGIGASCSDIIVKGGKTRLTVKGDKGAGILASTIYVDSPEDYQSEDININISNNAIVNITATGTSESTEMNGINAVKGNTISIDNSTVNSTVSSVGSCSAIIIDKDTTSEINILSQSNVVAKVNGVGSNSGIKSSGSVTITDSRVEACNINESAINGQGVNIAGTFTINGGNVILHAAGNVLGLSSSDKLLLGSGIDTDATSRVISASTVYNYNDSDMVAYDPANYANYKYIEIANVATYTLRYDAETGTLHKGSNTTALTTDEMNALGVAIDTDKKLILKGVDFKTTADKALEIYNGSAIVELAEGTINYLDASYTVINYSKYYGIYANNGLTIQGTGKLNINHNTVNKTLSSNVTKSYGIYMGSIDDVLNILGKDINIKGNGIYTFGLYSKKIMNIGEKGKNSDTNINIDLLGKYLSRGMYVESFTGYVNIYKSVVNIKTSVIDNNVSDDYACEGIFTRGSVNICEGADVNIDMDSDNITEYINAEGIFADGNITVDASTVDISGEIADVMGVKSQESINITNESIINIDIHSAVEGSRMYGLYVTGDEENGDKLVIENSKVTTKSDNAKSWHIYSYNIETRITKSDITIEAVLDSRGKGIYSNRSITITDCPNVAINVVSSGEDVNDIVVGIETYQNNINITNSTLDLDIKGYIGIGISAEEAKLYINNSTTDIEVNGISTTGLDSNATTPLSTALDAGAYIEIIGGVTNCKVNSIYDTKGIYLNGYSEVMSIEGVKIQGDAEVNIDSNNGLAIYIDANVPLNIFNTTCTLQGKGQAVYIAEGGSSKIKGKVEASINYDGTDKAVVTDINETYDNYRYISIIPSILSVNITWGDMDYTYTEGKWNSTLHSYDEGNWSNNTEDGDKIVVSNNSNVPILASFLYNKDSNYVGSIGTIMDSRISGTALSVAQKVMVNSSIDAYLIMSGRLPSSTLAKSTIGSVTVTISE